MRSRIRFFSCANRCEAVNLLCHRKKRLCGFCSELEVVLLAFARFFLCISFLGLPRPRPRPPHHQGVVHHGLNHCAAIIPIIAATPSAAAFVRRRLRLRRGGTPPRPHESCNHHLAASSSTSACQGSIAYPSLHRQGWPLAHAHPKPLPGRGTDPGSSRLISISTGSGSPDRASYGCVHRRIKLDIGIVAAAPSNGPSDRTRMGPH